MKKRVWCPKHFLFVYHNNISLHFFSPRYMKLLIFFPGAFYFLFLFLTPYGCSGISIPKTMIHLFPRLATPPPLGPAVTRRKRAISALPTRGRQMRFLWLEFWQRCPCSPARSYISLNSLIWASSVAVLNDIYIFSAFLFYFFYTWLISKIFNESSVAISSRLYNEWRRFLY